MGSAGRGRSSLNVDDPGRAYETSLEPDRRRRDGVHYTPRAVADALVARAFAPYGERLASGPFTVCDPTCGAGVFLLAAADALVAAGRSPADALACLRGMDIDPTALALTDEALRSWAAAHGLGDGPTPVLVVGDALNDPWPGEGSLTVVVGNPPFGGQLAGSTVRDGTAVTGAARILGRPAGYVDTASVLLVRALDAVAPGGSVVFVQPLSLLGSRDASIVRDLVGGALESIWIPDELLFDAAVHVCAPVLRKARAPVAEGRAPEPSPVSWTELAADAAGVPSADLRGEPLGTIASCTAGFRHEFYDVAGAVIEDDERSSTDTCGASRHPRLVTVGLIDPVRLRWGSRRARIAGVTFDRPVVDRDRLTRDHPLRQRPKVLVATQTRVVEAVADHDGSLWPSVPVISVLPRCPDPETIDLLVAALTAPPASVWAARRASGTARSPGAVRLRASLLEELPLPVDRELWERGATLLRAGDLRAAARPLTEAHRLDAATTEAILHWWSARVAGL